jgi:NTP pyrophosphatase (non-canonical NTP hydrolase)
MNTEMLHKLYMICEGLNNRFPGNRDPFRILARLTEECGEVASQVHHFEGIGRKPEKHGEPDKDKLAKEIQDVMTSVLSVAQHYGVEDELAQSIDRHYRMVIDEELVAADE